MCLLVESLLWEARNRIYEYKVLVFTIVNIFCYGLNIENKIGLDVCVLIFVTSMNFIELIFFSAIWKKTLWQWKQKLQVFICTQIVTGQQTMMTYLSFSVSNTDHTFLTFFLARLLKGLSVVKIRSSNFQRWIKPCYNFMELIIQCLS